MVREITPMEITPLLVGLCYGLNPEAIPMYIDVISEPWARVNECFPNVQRKIKESGGSYVNGWLIWRWANIMIEAEAHSVWKSDNGKLVDVTPHQENKILFVPDSNVIFEGLVIPSKRAPLTKSSKVSWFIDLLSIKDEYMRQAGKGKTYSLPLPLVEELKKCHAEITQKVGRNELCPCGSGLKYKKCCGPFYAN